MLNRSCLKQPNISCTTDWLQEKLQPAEVQPTAEEPPGRVSGVLRVAILCWYCAQAVSQKHSQLVWLDPLSCLVGMTELRNLELSVGVF